MDVTTEVAVADELRPVAEKQKEEDKKKGWFSSIFNK